MTFAMMISTLSSKKCRSLAFISSSVTNKSGICSNQSLMHQSQLLDLRKNRSDISPHVESYPCSFSLDSLPHSAIFQPRKRTPISFSDLSSQSTPASCKQCQPIPSQFYLYANCSKTSYKCTSLMCVTTCSSSAFHPSKLSSLGYCTCSWDTSKLTKFT
jgi:hypothetical protein